MSRPLRIHYPGAWYHVMNRGRRGEKIFYHLLVKTPDANLSRSMRHLNSLYTQRYNRRHGYDGPLFRGRYKSILVESDSYALELVRYIHRNPLEAGLKADRGLRMRTEELVESIIKSQKPT